MPLSQCLPVRAGFFALLSSTWLGLTAMLFVSSCTEQERSSAQEDGSSQTAVQPPSATLARAPGDTAQISQYIRRVFQDRDGNMWFGTTSDGVARYDGRSLTYFGAAEGVSDWVSSIAQVSNGDLWFGTRDGVVRYDGQRSTRYTTKDGLISDRVHFVLVDRSGTLWCATELGVSRYDGSTFTSFPIPAADLSHFPYYENPAQINWITEDRTGNIWFATNGGGAYRWDGKTLTNLAENEGLCNNFVQTMLEDRAGNMWFGTRSGGACKYDGSSFTTFGREELKGDNVFALYQDSGGLVWIGVTAYGLCSYNGSRFVCYNEADGAGIRVIMSMLEDAKGQLWLGTGAGLYRLEAGKFTNWTKADALKK